MSLVVSSIQLFQLSIINIWFPCWEREFKPQAFIMFVNCEVERRNSPSQFTSEHPVPLSDEYSVTCSTLV